MTEAASPWNRIELRCGDITRFEGDAIVNAGAIHRAAGSRLLDECRALGGCPTGDARITAAYDLPCQHVIHSVGPVYRDGRHGEPLSLASCHRRSIELAAGADAKTIAFPAISCGVYGYPVADAARVALAATAEALNRHPTIDMATFCLFSRPILDEFERAWRFLAQGE
jgi:O-acetyl-ADP-ribose deacetylase (regulator of RNase III)